MHNDNELEQGAMPSGVISLDKSGAASADTGAFRSAAARGLAPEPRGDGREGRGDGIAESAPKPPKKERNPLVLAAAVALFVFLGLFAAITVIGIVQEFFPRVATSVDNGNHSIFDNAPIGTVAESLIPSTVSVLTSSRSSGSYYDGAGSGIVVSSNGYVLTNRHVIEDARRVAVVINGEDIFEYVTIVGSDPLNDIDFLKINNAGNDFTAAPFGDSKSLIIGQEVIAIGNSLGIYSNTVTAGIISGMGRSISASNSDGSNPERLIDMIQTDAAINQGNSGGPLVNAGGQVIGINTAVSVEGQGIGFAIPIGAVKGMLRHLISTGRVERAYLGVLYVELDANEAIRYDLDITRGAYVYSSDGNSAVLPGSPAALGGIETGDIITKIGDVPIGRAGSLGTLLGEYAVGESVELTIIRGGSTITRTVTLAAYKN
jgi:serine protease Do